MGFECCRRCTPKRPQLKEEGEEEQLSIHSVTSNDLALSRCNRTRYFTLTLPVRRLQSAGARSWAAGLGGLHSTATRGP